MAFIPDMSNETQDDQYTFLNQPYASQMTYQQVTTKIPPAFNGRSSWFAYEEAVDDWLDVTELTPRRRGPALKNRLEEDAAVHKPMLDRDELKDEHTGVEYFKRTMRPFFVKGNQSVFLWRFFQLFRFHRGNGDFLKWIGKFAVLRKRITDAYGDLYEAVSQDNLDFHTAYNDHVYHRQAQTPPRDPETLEAALAEHNSGQKAMHMQGFPLSEQLFAWMFTCLADLNEQQRERLTSMLSIRGIGIQQYTFEICRTSFIELFCAPRSSLDNPNYRASGSSGKSFTILDQGTLENEHGFWAEDDETLEEGFLVETEDIFWVFDEENSLWIAKRFTGRRLTRGKGKGKGKGRKGKRKFIPFRKKGHANEVDWQQEEWWSDTTGDSYYGKKGRKGKGKGKGKGKPYADFGKSKGAKKGKSKGGKYGKPSEGSPDGKGKGEWTTILAEPAQQQSQADATAASVPREWDPAYDWNTDAGWYSEADWWHTDEWGQTFLAECEEITAESYLQFQSFNQKDHWETVQMAQSPTYAILDVGCTKAMGSRRAVMALYEVAHQYGMTVEFLPTKATFSFANSQKAPVTEKCRIWFPTEPPCWTEFDIIEEGTVPLLFSLRQMRNLHFTLEMNPDVVYLTCQALGFNRTPLRVATSTHLVIDLAGMQYAKTAVGPAPREWCLKDKGTNFDQFHASDTQPGVGEPGEQALPAQKEQQKSSASTKKPDAEPPTQRPAETAKGRIQEKAGRSPLLDVNPAPAKKQRGWIPVWGKADDDAATPVRASGLTPKAVPKAKPKAKAKAKQKPTTATPETEQQSGNPEPQPDAVPAPVEPRLPLGLRRIHEKLNSDVELLKIHLKHYHMSLEQFRRRTNQLKLPETVFKRYELIVKQCKPCMEKIGAPARSRISGLRADNFGDLLFMDHGQVKVNNKSYIFLLILDAASNLLWADPTGDFSPENALESLREWMDVYQCRPKAICADMAFMGPEKFTKFYSYHSIHPLPTGPRTPWPNRAETAVRLYKRMFAILVADVAADPSLKTVTIREVMRKACLARNSAVMFSGKTPLELAFGRKPMDLLDVENMTPEQLTADVPEAERKAAVLMRLAMKAHLEARQLQDLKHDIAKNLSPSDGPYDAGQKVFWWRHDQTKSKPGGVWVRAKVIRQQGAIVALDTGKEVVRVNQSWIRKDHDEWHDVPDVDAPSPDAVPGPERASRRKTGISSQEEGSTPAPATPPAPTEPPASPGAIPRKRLTLAKAQGQKPQLEASPVPREWYDAVEDCFWQAQLAGKIDVLELFAGSAHASKACATHGLCVGPPVDLRTGFDLNKRTGQEKAWKIIMDQKPDVVILAPKCSPWSAMSNARPWDQEKNRKEHMPMVLFCLQVAWHQYTHGKYFIWEQPQGSQMWNLPGVVELACQPGITWDTLHMCMFGMEDPVTGLKYKKAVSLLHNFPVGVLTPIFKRCTEDHDHQVVEGNVKGHGKRTALTQVYPMKFCNLLARLLRDFLSKTSFPSSSKEQSSLIEDILDLPDMTVDECTGLGTWLVHRASGVSSGLDVMCEGLKQVASATTPIRVTDQRTKDLMNAVNALSQGSEIVLHTPRNKFAVWLADEVKKMRSRYFPRQEFHCCAALRGTLGKYVPMHAVDDSSFVVMWKKTLP